MTNIIFRNRQGKVEGAINTGHDDPSFIRELAADAILTSRGAFGSFGAPGDSITIERGQPLGLGLTPGEGKLEKLCSGEYQTGPEDHLTATLYHVVDGELMFELTKLRSEGDQKGFSELVKATLQIEEDYGEAVDPGALFTSYIIRQVAPSLIAVVKADSANI